MSAMDNLRLPASELAKLTPRYPHDPAPPRARVVPTPSAPDAVAAAVRRRPRPVHHLSGFARA